VYMCMYVSVFFFFFVLLPQFGEIKWIYNIWIRRLFNWAGNNDLFFFQRPSAV